MATSRSPSGPRPPRKKQAGHPVGTGRSGDPHQPRMPNGDDEVEVGFQACLLGRRVLLYLSQGRSKSRPPPRLTQVPEALHQGRELRPAQLLWSLPRFPSAPTHYLLRHKIPLRKMTSPDCDIQMIPEKTPTTLGVRDTWGIWPPTQKLGCSWPGGQGDWPGEPRHAGEMLSGPAGP